MAAARSEDLRIPLAADGREICLCFHSKVYCIRFCTRSHAPVQVQNREAVLHYIRIGKDVMDRSKKRKFNGGGDWGSHGGHWERIGGNGTRNSEVQDHRNSAKFGGGRGVHVGGRQDVNNSGGGGAQGGNGNNTNPP